MTSKSPSGFHYFVHDGMNREEKVHAWVMDTLLASTLPQNKRESSKQWEFRHSASVTQFAKLLAQKRGVNEELASIAAGLHDVHVCINGTYSKHAQLGASIAKELLEGFKTFTKKEIEQVCTAIECHSDKQVYSSDPLVELVKDADALDCFFYGDTTYDYKPVGQRIHYYTRIVAVRKELGLPEKPYFKDQLRRLC